MIGANPLGFFTIDWLDSVLRRVGNISAISRRIFKSRLYLLKAQLIYSCTRKRSEMIWYAFVAFILSFKIKCDRDSFDYQKN